MDDTTRIAFAVLTVSLITFLALGAMGLLMIVNTNRRLRHRADLAEAERMRREEVQRAEREAVQHTLNEVGRELHDNVAQILSVSLMGVSNALRVHGHDDLLSTAQDALEQGVEEVRRLSHSLNSDMWRKNALPDAIGQAAERIERVARIKAHVVRNGSMPDFDGDTSTILFRVFQEAVHNAMKHSGASTLTIVLDGGPPFVLTVADNGQGYDPATMDGHAGLANLQRRCALIGFEARCMSAPGQGCTWTITQLMHHGRTGSAGG